MKTVSITFVGHESSSVAQAFYTWVLDGGLEDQLVDGLTRLSDPEVEVEGIFDFNNEELTIAFNSVHKP